MNKWNISIESFNPTYSESLFPSLINNWGEFLLDFSEDLIGRVFCVDLNITTYSSTACIAKLLLWYICPERQSNREQELSGFRRHRYVSKMKRDYRLLDWSSSISFGFSPTLFPTNNNWLYFTLVFSLPPPLYLRTLKEEKCLYFKSLLLSSLHPSFKVLEVSRIPVDQELILWSPSNWHTH